jgi:hypothetical protein
MTKWQIGPVKLVNGQEAFIDAINEEQEAFKYTGRFKSLGVWEAAGWDETGRKMYNPTDSPRNLAPPPKKTVRVKAWLMVWPNHGITLFYKKAEAVINAKKNGFALIEIDREVTEGEGLE